MKQNDAEFGLLSDDFVSWSNVTRTEWDTAFLRRATERRVGVVEVTIGPVLTLVDGDHVVIEAIGDGTTTGDHFDSTFVSLFELAGGKICSMREYCDTKRVADVLDPAIAERRSSSS